MIAESDQVDDRLSARFQRRSASFANIPIERTPMTMSKMRLLIPLLGLLAVAATQGCGSSTAVNNGSGGSVSSVGGSSGGGGAGGSPNNTSNKVTIVGSGS